MSGCGGEVLDGVSVRSSLQHLAHLIDGVAGGETDGLGVQVLARQMMPLSPVQKVVLMELVEELAVHLMCIVSNRIA